MKDVVARSVLLICAASVVLATAAMLLFLGRAGIRGVAEAGLGNLLSGTVWRPEEQTFGGFPLLFGTLVTALGGVVTGAIPALLAAVYVSELGPRGIRGSFRRIMELAAALPSVVYGWMALTYLVPALGGEGLLATGLLLGIMIGPTVSLLALDALGRVPPELRDASAALGASPLQTAVRVAFPSSSRGLVIAVFFGFARAAGETMAVQMVIGNARKLPDGLRSPTTTIAAQIVNEMGNAPPDSPHNDVLFSMALLLLVISVSVVLATRLLRRR